MFDTVYGDAAYAEDWTSIPSASSRDSNLGDLYRSPGILGRALFAERECDLGELRGVSGDAADAVLVAGVLLQAYLDDATRLPEA